MYRFLAFLLLSNGVLFQALGTLLTYTAAVKAVKERALLVGAGYTPLPEVFEPTLLTAVKGGFFYAVSLGIGLSTIEFCSALYYSAPVRFQQENTDSSVHRFTGNPVRVFFIS